MSCFMSCTTLEGRTPAALLGAHKHTFEQTPRVFLIQRQQLPGSLSDLGQGELDPPDLTFVPEPVLADQLQLLVEAGLLEGSPRGHIGFATNPAPGDRHAGSVCPSVPAREGERPERTRRRLRSPTTTPRASRRLGKISREPSLKSFIADYSFLPLSSYAHFTSNCFSVLIKGRIARKTLRPTPKIPNAAAWLT